MKLRAAVLALSVVFFAGCGGEKTAPKKITAESADSIDPGDLGDLNVFASHIESLVAKGDIAGLEGLWLLPEHLDGCSVEGKEVTKERMLSFAEDNIQELRTLGAVEMAEGRLGTTLHTNHWTEAKPNYLKGVLTGEACKAKQFGRVNVIIQPTKSPPPVVEHRFNAQLIDGTWRLYRYMPSKPNCDSPKEKGSIGCVKLAGG